MDAHELLKKIGTLPIIARGLAEELSAGNFSSVFKGQGIEFDEVRHYQRGDDIRSIDWNASARFGNPFVKMYREEKELTLLLLLDISASMRRDGLSSAENISPCEQALIAAALLAFSAERTGQRVGALLFDREVERVFPPRKGRRHIMALIGGALQYQNAALNSGHGRRAAERGQGSNLGAALIGAGRLLGRRSLVVLISDFLSVNWEDELEMLCRRHDVLALRIGSPPDNNLPKWGLAVIEDPETGLRITVPTGFPSFRESWSLWHRELAERWESVCRRCGAAHLELSTGADASAVLFHFFGTSAANPGFHNGRTRRHTTGGRRPPRNGAFRT